MMILTVKRPFGRPRRSTGAVSRLPLTSFTRRPLTRTSAELTANPWGMRRRMRKLRRLTQRRAEGSVTTFVNDGSFGTAGNAAGVTGAGGAVVATGPDAPLTGSGSEGGGVLTAV